MTITSYWIYKFIHLTISGILVLVFIVLYAAIPNFRHGFTTGEFISALVILLGGSYATGNNIPKELKTS